MYKIYTSPVVDAIPIPFLLDQAGGRGLIEVGGVIRVNM